MSLQNMTTVTTVTTVTATINPVLVKPEVLTLFLTLNLTIGSNIISILGIAGNILNIVNFSKEGFHETVNITLSALAVSDIGALVSQIAFCVLLSPFWDGVDMPFSSTALLSSQFFYPREYFIRVSGLITSFATFERCLSVVMPMKVKRLIKRRVSLTCIVLIFIILLLYLFPTNYVSYLDWNFDPKKNKTKIILFYRKNAETILTISYLVTDLCLPFFTFSVLILCNIVIVTKLKSKAKWRRSVAVNKKRTGTEISGKERKLVVMLTTVSIIFIACLLPQSAILTALGIVRELKLNGKLFDLSKLLCSFTYLLETINCSVNIIVYYKMSSKFRERLQGWVPFLQTNVKE